MRIPALYFSISLLTNPQICNYRACMLCLFHRSSTLHNAPYSLVMLAQSISSCKASHLWGVTMSVDYFSDRGPWRTHSFLSRSRIRTFGPCHHISWGSGGGEESQQCCCSSEWRKACHQICFERWCCIGHQSRSLSYVFRFCPWRVALDHRHRSRME